MKHSVFSQGNVGRQKGFSIVELMVSILIGLIILAGVVQVVVTSKTTFLGQEDMSFIQENARYAVDVIGKDLQSAGYWGCSGPGRKAAVAAKNSSAPEMLGIAAISGYDGDAWASTPAFLKDKIRPVAALDPSATTPQGYPDSLIVRGAEGTAAGVVSHNGGEMTLDRNINLTGGEFAVVVGEGCRRLSVIRTATASANKFTYDSTGNCGLGIKPSLIKPAFDCSEPYEAYLPGATVTGYGASAYFVGDSTALPGQPALKRSVLRGDNVVAEEVALGVEDMEILYGIQSAAGTQYKPANLVTNAEWPQVRSVQVALLFRSQMPSAPEASAEEFLGKNYEDRFMRQLVRTTFRLRNRT